MFRCSAEIHIFIKFLPFFDACWLHHIFPHVMQVSIARKKKNMTPYFSGQAKQLADHIRLWSYYASKLKVSNWGKLPLPSTYIDYVLLYSIIFMFGIVATATGFELVPISDCHSVFNGCSAWDHLRWNDKSIGLSEILQFPPIVFHEFPD